VPRGVQTLDVRFDYLSAPRAFGPGFGRSPDVTPHLQVIAFSQLVLYPADAPADAVRIEARVRIPPGWRFDGALGRAAGAGGDIALPAVPLTTLADSPILAGEFFRTIPLTQGEAPVRLSIAADRPADLAVGADTLAGLRNLVAEAAAVFGPGHYRRYVWLTALSGVLSHDGTEHAESSDVREAERLLTDPAFGIDRRLFPHEYVHSWNGKYRRPAGLDTVNLQAPMIDDLLWAYEGLTRYYGDLVLTARSGLAGADATRDFLAYVAAQMALDRPGRAWRTLADTAIAVPAFGDAPTEWTAIRRGSDYYNEMLLIWLEADMMIRRATQGRKSLDDVCGAFFSGPERAPAVRPYARSDLIEALRRVAPLDWAGFFKARLDTISAAAPLGGLEASGWTLDFSDASSAFLADLETTEREADLSFSLGLWGDDGVVRDAIVAAETSASPLQLTLSQGDLTRTVPLDYHAGLRIPHLRRDPANPDLLKDLLAPRAAHLGERPN